MPKTPTIGEGGMKAFMRCYLKADNITNRRLFKEGDLEILTT